MSGSASAAEAAVRNHHSGAASPAAGRRGGSFGLRQVSEGPQGLSLSESRGAAREAGQPGAPQGIRSRAVTTLPAVQSPSQRGVDVLREPQPGAIGQRRVSASVDEAAARATRAFSGAFIDLPWLTITQNVDRRWTTLRLDQFEFLASCAPAEIPPNEPIGEFRSAFRMVVAVEEDILRADELRVRSATKSLSDAERFDLTFNVRWQIDHLATYREQLDRQLDVVLAKDPGSLGRQAYAVHLRQRMECVHKFLRERSWGDSIPEPQPSTQRPQKSPAGALAQPGDRSLAPYKRDGALVLPVGYGRHVQVESSLVPGEFFAKGYPPVDDRPDGSPFWKHVAGLGHSVLKNARGEELYSGLCHAVIDLNALDGHMVLRSYAGRESARVGFAQLVGDLLVEPGASGADGSTTESLVNDCRLAIHNSGWAHAADLASRMRARAAGRMGREVAVAALVTDAEKCRKALDGETVDLHLCAVTYLSPIHTEFRYYWDPSDQNEAYAALGRSSPVELSLHGPDGELKPVRANIKVRHLMLADSDAVLLRERLSAELRVQWTRLLGPGDSTEPGGDVRARADAMRGRILELRDELAKLDPNATGSSSNHGSAGPDLRQMRNGRSGVKRELERLERNRRTLLEAARQLKEESSPDCVMVGRSGGCSTDRFEDTLSRLALIGYLMGEVPVVCDGGTLAIGQRDADVKFLATAAETCDGSPPLVAWDRAWTKCSESFRQQLAEQSNKIVREPVYQQQTDENFYRRSWF